MSDSIRIENWPLVSIANDAMAIASAYPECGERLARYRIDLNDVCDDKELARDFRKMYSGEYEVGEQWWSQVCDLRKRVYRYLPEIVPRLKHVCVGVGGRWHRDANFDWPGSVADLKAIAEAAMIAAYRGEADATAVERTGARGTKRRRTAVMQPLTQLQQQAVELYAKHNGIVKAIAAEMKIKHSTVNQHLNAAWRKLPHLMPNKTAPVNRSRRLPADRRGQPTV